MKSRLEEMNAYGSPISQHLIGLRTRNNGFCGQGTMVFVARSDLSGLAAVLGPQRAGD